VVVVVFQETGPEKDAEWDGEGAEEGLVDDEDPVHARGEMVKLADSRIDRIVTPNVFTRFRRQWRENARRAPECPAYAISAYNLPSVNHLQKSEQIPNFLLEHDPTITLK